MISKFIGEKRNQLKEQGVTKLSYISKHVKTVGTIADKAKYHVLCEIKDIRGRISMYGFLIQNMIEDPKKFCQIGF